MTYRPIRAHGLGSTRNGVPDRKPYVYRGGQRYDGPQDTGRRARAVTAEPAGWLDPGGPDLDDPGYEWRRELLDGADTPAHVIPLEDPAPHPPVIVPRQPAAAAARCPVCRYLLDSIGHKVNCHE